MSGPEMKAMRIDSERLGTSREDSRKKKGETAWRVRGAGGTPCVLRRSTRLAAERVRKDLGG